MGEGGNECVVYETFGHGYVPSRLVLNIQPLQVEGALGIFCKIFLADGTYIGTVINQFRDTPEGLEVRLEVNMPSAMDPALITGHEDHLAVEFNNWVRDAHRLKAEGKL
jgi:hypothetical protein